jgi:hypothetical protein
VPANGAGITYITFHPAAEFILLLSIAAGLMSGGTAKLHDAFFCE